MKIPHVWIALLAVGAACPLVAQGKPDQVSTHAGNASGHVAAAGSEAAAASAAAAASGLRLVSGVAAVPVWLSGNVLAGSGEAAKAVGQGLWDLATGEPAARPKLDAKIGLPPPPVAKPAVPSDPSPADALKQG